jgi:hypothetical protein
MENKKANQDKLQAKQEGFSSDYVGRETFKKTRCE